ncbi:RNA polymerase sporulation-specific sigma factor [Desulfohalotomaculum tongense]|uniref:sigma factor n=1 Tax=Desulforadius tongensis TaxID=1216062 RepID=UPI0019599F2F|nr:sigma factor [Desulforadius tongensis]MBM7854052.1 RNA polymerase sporulation-specific sigma factor [Desulforadius tongensis]
MPAGLWAITIISVINGMLLLVSFISSYTFPQSLAGDEEAGYLELAKKGDEKALNVLVERNLSLVAEAVKKFEHLDVDGEDLIFAGTIGLIKAIKTYNNQENISLATYAANFIAEELSQLKKAQ